jgi:hypothetical protein
VLYQGMNAVLRGVPGPRPGTPVLNAKHEYHTSTGGGPYLDLGLGEQLLGEGEGGVGAAGVIGAAQDHALEVLRLGRHLHRRNSKYRR